jgi:hypothetical protein
LSVLAAFLIHPRELFPRAHVRHERVEVLGERIDGVFITPGADVRRDLSLHRALIRWEFFQYFVVFGNSFVASAFRLQ